MIVNILCGVLGFILLLALWFEYSDYRKLGKIPFADDIKNPKDRARHYRFLAKFPYENSATWRMTYVTSLLATLFLWFIFYMAGSDFMTTEILLIFFMVIFLCFYVMQGITFQLFYRKLASKADPNVTEF